MKRNAKPVLLGVSALTWALVAVASVFPDARVWGINHLAYFPMPLRLLLLGLVAIAFVPWMARQLVDGFLGVTASLLRSGRAGVVLSVGIAVLSVALFWFLRTGTPLLGDGHLLVKSFDAAEAGDPNLIPSSTRNIFASERIAIGTHLLNLWTGKLAHALWGSSWIDGWRLFNCVLGGVFVLVLLRVAASAGWRTSTRLWLLVLVLFSAAQELFFGYPENYTPLTLGLLLYAVACVRVLHLRGSLLWPIVAWLVAVFLHVQALVLLPSLVFVLLWRTSAPPRTFVERRLPALLVALMLLGLGFLWVSPLRGYLLSWLPPEPGVQAVLDIGHTIDIANEILLVLPAALFFGALAWCVGLPKATDLTNTTANVPSPAASAPAANVPAARTRRGRRRRGSASSDATRASQRQTLPPAPWLQTHAEWLFFLLMTAGCLLYLVFFEAEIGVARDWDLFAMILVGLAPAALLLWNQFLHRVQGFRLHEHAVLVAPMLTLTLVLGMSWVLLNHSVGLGTRRFESILTWETARVEYGYEALAATYHSAGRRQDAVRIMERAVEISPNTRLRALLGTYHFDAGDHQQARDILLEELERNPRDERLRMWLVRTLHELRDFDTQARVLSQGLELHPENLRYHLLLGELLIRMGRVQEGVQHLRAGRASDMPAEARAEVDRMIRQYETPAAGNAP